MLQFRGESCKGSRPKVNRPVFTAPPGAAAPNSPRGRLRESPPGGLPCYRVTAVELPTWRQRPGGEGPGARPGRGLLREATRGVLRAGVRGGTGPEVVSPGGLGYPVAG